MHVGSVHKQETRVCKNAGNLGMHAVGKPLMTLPFIPLGQGLRRGGAHHPRVDV